MASPVRASMLPSLEMLDHKKTMAKIKGHDLDLLSPASSPRSHNGAQTRSSGHWEGSQKFAADLKRLAVNRHLRELRSKNWQERLRACEYLGKNLTLRSYKGVARLVDLIAAEKDSNVVDAALQALLQINGHHQQDARAIDRAAGSPRSLQTPLPSTAGLSTPMTGSSTPLRVNSPCARPRSGVRPTSAATRVTPTISEDTNLSTTRSNHTAYSVLGARPLGQQLVHSDAGGAAEGEVAQGDGAGRGIKVGKRPLSALVLGTARWRVVDDGGGRGGLGAVPLELLSPLVSPLVLEMSKRRSATQKVARADGSAVLSVGLLGAAYRGSLSLGGDLQGGRDTSSSTPVTNGGAMSAGVLRPQSAPASRLKTLLNQTASKKESRTIGDGRTIYDEKSYNRLAAPNAEQTILSMAIDQFAAQAAIDEVALTISPLDSLLRARTYMPRAVPSSSCRYE